MAETRNDPRNDPEVRARWEAELDAQIAELDAAIAACPNCKIAKTFARKRTQEGLTGELARMAERRIEDAACKRHRGMHGLLYRTSPLSETYWAS